MNSLTQEQYISKFYRNPQHAYEVKKLSLMLFDEVNALLKKLPLKSRKLLEAAALLHDIGYNIDTKDHNKHSYNIICKNGIKDFNDDEIILTAHIARYHRASLPNKTKHKAYSLLKKKERKLVKRLSAILRICDGLDRAHMKLIKELKAQYDEDNNIFTILLTSNIIERTPDISSAMKKKDLFEKVYKTQVIFKFT